MLCWWAWISCVVSPGTDQQDQDPAGSSAAAVVAAVAAAECAACGGPGVEASVGLEPDVMRLAESGTGQVAGEEAALSERRVEIVPGQTAGESSALVVVVVVVVVVAAAAAAADEPAPGATAWTAGADGFAGTAANTTVLGSKASLTLALHHPPATFVEAGKTASPGV